MPNPPKTNPTTSPRTTEGKASLDELAFIFLLAFVMDWSRFVFFQLKPRSIGRPMRSTKEGRQVLTLLTRKRD